MKLNVFLNFSETPSLMHELFISVLFMFQMSLHTLGEKYFQKIISSYLSVAFSTLILQWSENILCMISILLKMLRCMSWPSVSFYFGDYFTCSWEKWVFSCSLMEYSIYVNLIKLIYSAVQVTYVFTDFWPA